MRRGGGGPGSCCESRAWLRGASPKPTPGAAACREEQNLWGWCSGEGLGGSAFTLHCCTAGLGVQGRVGVLPAWCPGTPTLLLFCRTPGSSLSISAGGKAPGWVPGSIPLTTRAPLGTNTSQCLLSASALLSSILLFQEFVGF